MLTAALVAKQLGISARAVYALHDAGALRGYRFGRSVRFDESDLQEYRDRCLSTASKTVRAALASSLNSAVVFQAGGSALENSFRRLGVELRPMRSTARNPAASTLKHPASSRGSGSSTTLLLVTSAKERSS